VSNSKFFTVSEIMSQPRFRSSAIYFFILSLSVWLALSVPRHRLSSAQCDGFKLGVPIDTLRLLITVRSQTQTIWSENHVIGTSELVEKQNKSNQISMFADPALVM
jgi:hypothetical protein